MRTLGGRKNVEASPARRRKQGVVVSYLYTGAQVLVNLLYVPLLLSIIGQDGYGLYQTVGSIIAYVVSINSVLSAGVGRFYSMYKAGGDEDMMESTLAIAKRLYWILSVGVVAVVVAVVPVFRWVYSESFTTGQLDECSVMLVILALNTVVTFNNTVNIAVINANERFVFLKVSQLLTLVAQPVAIIVLGRFWPSAITITVIILVMNVLCSALQHLYVRSVLRAGHAYHGWNGRLVRGLLSFSVAVVMVAVADQLFWTSGNLVVAYFHGAGSAAVYGVGSQVYRAYLTLGMGVSSVFFQRVSELYHRDHDMTAISDLFAKVGRVSFLVCSLVLGGFVVLGQDFLILWAGEGFEDAYLVALAVMVPLTVDLIQNLGLTIMQVEDKYRFRGYMYLTLAVVNIALSVILVPRFGIIGAAVSSGLCMFLGNGLVMNWYYSKHAGLDIRLFWREIWCLVVPVLFATIITLVVYQIVPVGHKEIWLLIAGGVFYLVLYALFVGKWGLNDYERGMMRSALAKVPVLRVIVGR